MWALVGLLLVFIEECTVHTDVFFDALSHINAKAVREVTEAHRTAWGRVLPVPAAPSFGPRPISLEHPSPSSAGPATGVPGWGMSPLTEHLGAPPRWCGNGAPIGQLSVLTGR